MVISERRLCSRLKLIARTVIWRRMLRAKGSYPVRTSKWKWSLFRFNREGLIIQMNDNAVKARKLLS
jgi:hypothetical protein